MGRWADVVQGAPELAARVTRLFDARRHKVLGTLRRDGAPRLSGIETAFEDGDITFGVMPESLKGADLLRDARMALHAASDDPAEDDPASWQGDAKISGVAVPIPKPEDGSGGSYFRVEIDEVVFTRLNETVDRLVIESWRPDRGYVRRERA